MLLGYRTAVEYPLYIIIYNCGEAEGAPCTLIIVLLDKSSFGIYIYTYIYVHAQKHLSGVYYITTS